MNANASDDTPAATLPRCSAWRRNLTDVSLFTGPTCNARRIVRGIVLLAVLVLPGCGDEPVADPLAPTERDAIENLPSSIADLLTDKGPFEALFTEGAAPSESERTGYNGKMFRTVGEPAIEGDTATFTVLVMDELTDRELGEAEWSAVKEGDQWKLKSAPLP